MAAIEAAEEWDVEDVDQMTTAMEADKLPEQYLKYTQPYHAKVKGKNDHLEAYVRLQRRAGCLRVTVPFPVGVIRRREKTFRLSDHMTVKDMLSHAKYIRKMWTTKSIALRNQFLTPKQARRMAKPNDEGCIGTMRYRRAINQFAVPYIDARGFMQHKIFYIPKDALDDPVAVYAIKDEAIAFAKNLLTTGTGTPIRRRFRRPFHVKEVNPITRYFSNIDLKKQPTVTPQEHIELEDDL